MLIPVCSRSFALAGVALTTVLLFGCTPQQTPASDPLAKARQDNERAAALIEKGKHAEAEPLLRSAIAADPSFGQAHNNLGLVYYKSGNLYQAAWAFEEATRLMPRRPEPQNNLGLVYEQAGQLTKAVDAYAAARSFDMNSIEYLANLTRAKVRRGDTDPDTRRLLEELILKDARPEWSNWARMSLLKVKGASAATQGS